jgi:hypothetical protein
VGGLVLLALIALWQGPSLWHDVRERYWRQQCWNYAAPVGRVVYDEDPLRAAPLVREGGAMVQLDPELPAAFIANDPDCWTTFTDLNRYALSRPGAVVFLHGRATHSGDSRLICLVFGGWNHRRWEFVAHVYRRNGYSSYLTGVDVPLEPGATPLRLFAGQPDAADESHFTFTYEANGQKGTIDGWLQAGDVVKLQLRDGPAGTRP